MSRIIRALEKAEQEKEPKKDEKIILELLTAEAAPQKKEIPRPRVHAEPEIVRIPVSEQAAIPIAFPDSFAAEQIRKIKTFIFTRAGKDSRFILITSALPGEGKTTIAMNLALSISHEIDKKVILVDADLRKPNILAGKHPKGLLDYLKDQVSLKEIIYPEGDNLAVIPAGFSSPRAAELIGSKKMMDFKKDLREISNGSYVIIDAPPVLASSEPHLLSEWVDGVILVVMAEKVSKGDMHKVIDSIGREKFLGMVFNHRNLKISKKYPYAGYYQSAKRK
jgi:non-specific protein-tyrosine kinase